MQSSMTSSGRAEQRRRPNARRGAGMACGAFAMILAVAGGASADTLDQVTLDEGLGVDPDKTTKPNVAYYDYINREDCLNREAGVETLFYRFKSASQSTVDKVLVSMDDSDCCTA